MINNQKAIIIVAGGKGTRMGASLPKQFIRLGSRPILMHTIERFFNYDRSMTIIVVLPKNQQEYWTQLCKDYNFDVPFIIADGGKTRFHSVCNGLSKVTNERWIGVHDGVRPFVSDEVITTCFRVVQSSRAVIPTIGIVETLRKVEEEKSSTLNRDDYRLVQTPQVFDVTLLKEAYQQEYNKKFTDDASVVEALGYDVTLIEGNRENIKVTTPFDLKIGEALL